MITIDRNSVFFKQAKLMMQVMPFVEKETCFALKGGTAINFFFRDMPRLSVDIDLAYLPIEPRESSLRKIGEALDRIANTIRKSNKRVKVQEGRAAGGKRATKLFIHNGEVQIKIEPNEVIRGTVFACSVRSVSSAVEEVFESSATLQVLSIADLYGGKISAALDRQHPRDLFDVKLLLENEGITPDIRKAFVVYLAGHDRPIHELLDPKLKDVKGVYEREFAGMTTTAISYEDLTCTREQFIAELRSGLTAEERQFLISIKERRPDWALLGVQGIEALPSIQWKLANLAKMKADKHMEYVNRLKNVLKER